MRFCRGDIAARLTDHDRQLALEVELGRQGGFLKVFTMRNECGRDLQKGAWKLRQFMTRFSSVGGIIQANTVNRDRLKKQGQIA